MRIRVGDRVSCVNETDGLEAGDEGRVVGVSSNGGTISVDWDILTRGHDCDGRARQGHGLNLSLRDIKVLEGADRKPTLYIATYNNGNSYDLHIPFISKQDLDEWIKDAEVNKGITFPSIMVFEVKGEYAIKTSFSLAKL